MAKIRKHEIRLNGNRYDAQISYSARSSRFEVRLPEVIEQFIESSETPRPTGKTEAELVKAIDALIQRFGQATTKERKVICYEAGWGSKNVKSNVELRWNQDEFPDEAKISFRFHILIEREVAGNARYYRWVENDDNIVPASRDEYDGQIIDWTAEREAWMREFYGAVEKLMGRLVKSIGTTQLLLQTIDKNVKLLEAPR